MYQVFCDLVNLNLEKEGVCLMMNSVVVPVFNIRRTCDCS